MYGAPGTAYVYLVYGMHDCLNIITEPEGRPAALLVRAVEPLAGIEAMRESRRERATARRKAVAASPFAPGTVIPEARLGSGPGLVCAIFDIDRSLTGQDLLDPAGEVRLEARPRSEPEPEIVAGPRVGVAYAGEPWTSVPWRLSIRGNASVSRPKPVAD
jgi:DNA-3-methyladenine glycosylase